MECIFQVYIAKTSGGQGSVKRYFKNGKFLKISMEQNYIVHETV